MKIGLTYKGTNIFFFFFNLSKDGEQHSHPWYVQ